MRLVVYGTGAIGGYLGSTVVAHQLGVAPDDRIHVTLVGRPSFLEEIQTTHCVTVSAVGTKPVVLEEASIGCITSAPEEALSEADAVLVCVKSAATQSVADMIRQHAHPDCLVVSCQNGLRARGELEANVLPTQTVCGCVVDFNVLWSTGPVYHRTTHTGNLVLQRPGKTASGAQLTTFEALLPPLGATGIPVLPLPEADFLGRQHSKLLINLINAVNGLAGVPVRAMLADEGYRRVWSACIREGIAAFQANGRQTSPLPPGIPVAAFPHLLELPTAVFLVLLKPLLPKDPNTRSSLLQDLDRGRRTEVDYLLGEVVALGEAGGVPTPVSTKLVRLVHEAEEQGGGSPKLSSEILCQRVGLPSQTHVSRSRLFRFVLFAGLLTLMVRVAIR